VDTEEIDALDRARGGYVGGVDRDGALNAIRAHSTGPVLIEYPERGFAGGLRRHCGGWQVELGGLALPEQPIDVSEQEPRLPHSCVFAFLRDDRADVSLGTGAVYVDVPVLDLSGPDWKAERYTDGLDLHFASDLTVRLVFWHLAGTEGGELVPGVGFMVCRSQW
jgi:hypothetical protein